MHIYIYFCIYAHIYICTYTLYIYMFKHNFIKKFILVHPFQCILLLFYTFIYTIVLLLIFSLYEKHIFEFIEFN